MRSTLLIPCLAVLFVSCAKEPDTGPARNVVLISIDTLRADHLSSHGHSESTTPNIDRFVRRGVSFDDASATAPWTVPSHFSMLTGLYPSTHGVIDWKKILPGEVRLISELLSGNGFRTGAVVNYKGLNQKRGFTRGFQHYVVVPTHEQPQGTTPEVIERATDWITSVRAEPFFLFLHLYDVHSDYTAQDEYLERFVGPYDGPASGRTKDLKRFRSEKPDWGAEEARHIGELYDAGLGQTDDQLKQLFAYFEESGMFEDTLFVLTSDHGEEFLEHGDVLHGRTLHQELIHVPMAWIGPGIDANRRFDDPVSLVDVVPTVLSMLRLDVPEGLEGVDLSPLWFAGEGLPPRSIFAEADAWYLQEPGNYRRAVRRGRFKLTYDHLSKARVVYDLDTDATERADISENEPILADALWTSLKNFLSKERGVAETTDLSEEEIQRLEDLGYL